LTTFPKTEKRVENTPRSGVFFTDFEVFGNVVKHSLGCFIYLLNQGENEEIKSLKSMIIKIRYPNTATVMISFVQT